MVAKHKEPCETDDQSSDKDCECYSSVFCPMKKGLPYKCATQECKIRILLKGKKEEGLFVYQP
jgi:hypothetical protein